jgi:hypothetical protein
VRLALDHHWSPRIAAALRERGLDAVSVGEMGWHLMSDGQLLEACRVAGRCLLTNDVADFMALVRQRQVEGRAHGGLVLTSDSRWPRTAAAIGVTESALAALMKSHPADNGLAGQVVWLAPASAQG